jgi:membrane-associated protease RseP (regulator of RpoE activity)
LIYDIRYPQKHRVIIIKNILLNIFLFSATFFTTTLAGVMWLNKDPFDLSTFVSGLSYSIPLVLFLGVHEFGHYFAARIHRIKTTLPYFIPVPPFLLNPFGTMGAIIKIKEPIQSKKALLDIGIAGPLSGFAIALIIYLYGLFTLPPIDYLYIIHPEYKFIQSIPSTGLTFGSSILIYLTRFLIPTDQFFPPMNEIYHYPFLCVGWFGFFITSLNLIPIGQLDGGHILYALIGKKQGIVARIFFIVIIIIGLSSFLPGKYFSIEAGTIGWLVFAFILFFIIKLSHPPILDETPLDSKRKTQGWIAILIFIISFVPTPLYELTQK